MALSGPEIAQDRIEMTRTLVIANQKGGVGKSTSVMNLGIALATRGQRVLLVDLDPQGGLTGAFGLDSYAIPLSTFSLLMSPQISIGRVVRKLRERLALVPASLDLAAAEIQLANASQRALRLRQALQRETTTFDYILIDTPPGLGVLTANGLVAADDVLIPVQCQYLAMRGVRALLETVVRIRKHLNPTLRLGGVFATMYRPNSTHAREVVEEMRAVFGHKMFRTLIHYDEAVAEAPVAGVSLLEYAPVHPVAQAYHALAEEVSGGEQTHERPTP